MKNKRTLFIGIIGSLLILFGLFYVFAYNNFTKETLSSIEVQYIGTLESVEEQKKVVDPKRFKLSEEEKSMLFQSLEWQNTNKIEQLNDLEQEDIVVYTIQIVNKFNQKEDYKLFLKDRNTAYAKENITIYQLEDPEFFYTHKGFNQYYQEKYLPDIEMSESAEYGIEEFGNHWRIQQYDDQWIENNLNEFKDAPKEQSKPDFLLQNEDDQPKLKFNQIPDEMTYRIIDEDTKEEKELLFEDKAEFELLPIPEKNGEYRYQLEFIWEKPEIRKSSVSFTLEVLLPVNFEVSKTTIYQGDIIEIEADRAASAKDLEIRSSLGNKSRWHKFEELFRTLIPTNYHTEPGEYSIELIDKKSGSKELYNLTVLAHDYKTQYLAVDTDIQAATRNAEAYEEQDQYYKPIRTKSNGERFYRGDFLLPTEGRLTTEFGERRYVNDELTSYRHNGIDIAAPQGTEILATNNGEVVFTRELILTGNTIVIDHGQGIFSTYLHLHEMDAKPGAFVEKGDRIGTVGTTGFSTGPHLHFTLSYYDVPLEPGYFIEGSAYSKEKNYYLDQ